MSPARPLRTALPVLLLLALAAACSEDKSFVVVSVFSSVHSIANVAQLRVKVTDGQYNQQLLYPDKPRAATALLQLNDTTPVTFSVSLRTMFKDDVTLDVEPLDATQASLGRGTGGPYPLRVGQVTYATVYVSPACDPMAPTEICGAGKTCALVCDQNSQPEMLCFPAGPMNPGDPCTYTTDCLPGSECFEFNAPTCVTVAQPVKTCRQFCNIDSDCGAGSCNSSVSCKTTSTSLHLCSRPCDPTGDATGGCAAGLLCFIYTGEVTDCACLDRSRVGAVGVSCTTDENCQPGLMCVDRGGSKSCQTICQLSSPKCATGTCTRLTNPDYQVFGACL
ncbi:MAG TPA: hypothetical protein VJ801_15885 [Polyangia bacterium]|jgi:hypothetical protein|nr:hypothetical protein [Polyangia bacterium]